MKQWFTQLAPREQLLVGIAGILVILTVIVTLAVRPIINKAVRGHESVANKQVLLSDIDRVAARIGPQTGATSTSGNGNQSLVVIVDRTTRSYGLATYLKRNQPDGATSIRLRFENAPFDAVVEWLGTLQNQHGLRATAANIDTTSATGRVNCNLTLARDIS